ncbi:MAG: metallophosphoesterase [Fervidicoccaceae archaeon]
MKIGVISDTHDNLALATKWARFFEREKVNAIVHLGDNNSPFIFKNIFEKFQGMGYAVLGNNDGDRVLIGRLANVFNIKIAEYIMIQEIDGMKIIFMHGFGSPEQTRLIVDSLAKSGNFSAILYGHTHEPRVETLYGTFILNPGEGGGVLTGKATVALLQTKPLSARIIGLEDLEKQS